ncbi:MAG: glycosyltransferase family 4 protein [Candidatus Sumerlaeia bacterium]|nr:glycosyltransferase family 4 protein [Candidatus Sumerlaeia bacterium]
MQNDSPLSTPQYLVIQTGARRRYAVPALFHEHQMGGWLYTDFAGNTGWGKNLGAMIPKAVQPAGLKKLLGRQIPKEILPKTTTFEWSSLKYSLAMRRAGRNPVLQAEVNRAYQKDLRNAMKAKGFGEWTHVYSMFGEGHEFLHDARNEGRKVVTEVFLSPDTHRIMQKLRLENPDLESPLALETIQFGEERWNRVLEMTDYFIVPSPFVAETLWLPKSEMHRVLYVPYCTPPGWTSLETQTEPGRVLFVGSCELRKGIHILADAAQQFRGGITWRVAGGVSEIIRRHPRFKGLNFLGRVARTAIHEEFARADVFVLPSFAEGSAEVIFEALALGLPVITTYESGSVIRHEREGLIIPKGDPTSLATAIERIVRDREFRDYLSRNARNLARFYEWEHYGRRLTHACSTFSTLPEQIP